MDLGIAGRVALVCGSSGGLGRAIGQALAAEGCRVVLNGRNAAQLDRAVEQLQRDTSAEVAGFTADVGVPADATDLVNRVHHEFGAVDILVANAGGPAATTFRDASSEQWQAALDLNLLSTIHLCRAAIPHMRRSSWGRILCLTSIAAKQPLSGLILSSTARAAVLGFAKSLADEVAPDGVTVNVVCPGYMRTERVSDLVAERATIEDRDEAAIVKEMVGDIPMGRMGEPDELAAAFAFLASESARYITGAVLQVDGGYIRSIL